MYESTCIASLAKHHEKLVLSAEKCETLLGQLHLPQSASCGSTCLVYLYYMGLLLLSTTKEAKHRGV